MVTFSFLPSDSSLLLAQSLSSVAKAPVSRGQEHVGCSFREQLLFLLLVLWQVWLLSSPFQIFLRGVEGIQTTQRTNWVGKKGKESGERGLQTFLTKHMSWRSGIEYSLVSVTLHYISGEPFWPIKSFPLVRVLCAFILDYCCFQCCLVCLHVSVSFLEGRL